VTFHDEHGGEEAEQFLVAAVLRPGNVPATAGARGLLRRLIRKLRKVFPEASLRVRLDGGFAAPETFAFLEAQRVEYLVNMPSNAVLERMAEPFLRIARERVARSKDAAQVYTRALVSGADVAAPAFGHLQGRKWWLGRMGKSATTRVSWSATFPSIRAASTGSATAAGARSKIASRNS